MGDVAPTEVAAQMNGVEYKAVAMGNGTSKKTSSAGGSTTSTPLNSAPSTQIGMAAIGLTVVAGLFALVA